jgi:hypothetical protein
VGNEAQQVRQGVVSWDMDTEHCSTAQSDGERDAAYSTARKDITHASSMQGMQQPRHVSLQTAAGHGAAAKRKALTARGAETVGPNRCDIERDLWLQAAAWGPGRCAASRDGCGRVAADDSGRTPRAKEVIT